MAFGGRGFTATEFAHSTDYTEVASANVETTLLAGQNLQPFIPPNLLGSPDGINRSFTLFAAGSIGSTGTPTMTFTVRMSSTQGSGTLTGSILGISTAITMGNSVTNKLWELWLRIHVKTPGQGTGNATVTSHGIVYSPGGSASASGFASPFMYSMLPTAPDTVTWTQTYDGSVQQYINLSVTPSVSDPANRCRVKHLEFSSNN